METTMKIAEFDIEAGDWREPKAVDAMGLRVEVPGGTFHLSVSIDGSLRVRSNPGTILIGPEVSNSVSIHSTARD